MGAVDPAQYRPQDWAEPRQTRLQQAPIRIVGCHHRPARPSVSATTLLWIK